MSKLIEKIIKLLKKENLTHKQAHEVMVKVLKNYDMDENIDKNVSTYIKQCYPEEEEK